MRQCPEKDPKLLTTKKVSGTTGRIERGEMYQLCLRWIKLKAANSSKILTTVQHDP